MATAAVIHTVPSGLPLPAAVVAVWRDPVARTLLASGVLLHLLLALGVHLSPDEAHYALYAHHLDWSYFDHPPLVGWLQWPAVSLGGADWLLRIVPMLAWVATALMLVHLAGQLFPVGTVKALAGRDLNSVDAHTALPPTARAALWLLLLSPLPHLLGMALVPDSLLAPLSLATLSLTWRLCDARATGRLGTWLALGLCLGLAGLAKYTAVLLAVSAVLALGWVHGLRLLTLRGPWLTAVLAMALVSPVLVWNAAHGWISFAYQLAHAAGTAAWLPWRLGAFLLAQLLVYGLLPLLGLVAARRLPMDSAAVAVGWAGRRLSPLTLSLCFFLPTALLLCKLSGRGSTLPHWSAPAWVAVLPVAAAGCQWLWQQRPHLLRGLAIWQGVGVLGMAALLLAGGLAHEGSAQLRTTPGQGVANAARNPVADLYGWDAAARQAQVLAAQHGVPRLAVMNWSMASRMAWYARPMPVKVVHYHGDQFDLWFGPLHPGDSVLWVDWSLMSFEPPVGPQRFRHCRLLAQQPVRHAGRVLAHFNFSLCEHWQGPARPMPGQSGPVARG